jgi:dipeptidyl aminopeptidase/acylaminoacyl peptidase/uncharacterized protein (DUF885 family)
MMSVCTVGLLFLTLQVRPALAVELIQSQSALSRPGQGAHDSQAGMSNESKSVSPQRRGRGFGLQGVYKARIQPNWFADNTKFWYRNDLADRAKEFVVVDVEKGTRAAAFDHGKLAESLSKAAETTIDANRLPFNEIEFTEDGAAIKFVAENAQWEGKLETYECTKLGAAPEDGDEDDEAADRGFGRGRRRFGRGDDGRRGGAGPSPDGKWNAYVRDNNVYIRAASDKENEVGDRQLSDGPEYQLTTDGTEDTRYGMLQWAPDSKTLVGWRIEPGDRKEVYLIESSPDGGGRAKLRQRPYDLPGDKLTSYELTLFSVETKKQTKPKVEKIDLHFPRIYWNRDGRHFAYEKVDRGHQRLRIIRVDSHTGDSSDIIDERTDTFIWTAHTENLDLERINWLPDTDEAIYVSERDGWRHLYLLNTFDGGIKNQITQGEYVVRGIDRIDEEKRQIWFHASGKNADQDPYFMHYYRVNFDGTGLVTLTDANGNHTVQFSPDHKYVIDTYSRVDMPPKHELRRADDGELVCALEEADASELMEQDDYHPLEVFVAKGRDGKTDMWGIICRPRNFDPNKKYPILESIYAGPQGSFVPKSFGGGGRYASMADLGFIVVQIDGMGTANRSKAFHDECWHDLKDAGFADRILWIKAAAEKYPYMDTSRVGIYGGSAGGQNAAAGVLFHPEFYKAAVAGCGCHDNRMDKASWNEQWMGYPVGPQYAECSNIDNAHRLQGKLMLIVGELDDNVPTESTYRFTDALIKADKDFDLILVPGAGHGMGGEYGSRRMRDFFVRHLLGTEVPDRNASATRIAQQNGEDRSRERNGISPDDGPIDLAALQPPSNVSKIASHFRADLASLRRYYVVEESPASRDRFRKFYIDWLAALVTLPTDSLKEDERREYEELKNDALESLADFEREAKRRARAAEFVPFGPAIIELAEQRRQVKKADIEKSAALLDMLVRQIDKQREKTDARLKARGTGNEPISEETLKAAADTVGELRSHLRSWFRFYDGYDPLFSWWMRAPYAQADEALEKYAALLEKPSVADDVAVTPASSSGETEHADERTAPTSESSAPSGDVPDLAAIIAEPASQMEPIIAKFRGDFPGWGDWGSRSGTRLPRSRRSEAGARDGQRTAPNEWRGEDNSRAQRAGRRGNNDVRSDESAEDDNVDQDRSARSRTRRRMRDDTPEGREQLKRLYAEWLSALDKLDFGSFSQSDKVDYLLLKNHIQHRVRKLDMGTASGDDERPAALDSSGIAGRPIGREALLAELKHELIPYTPEELINIAARENEWCQAELLKASREMGFGDDWQKAVEKVKTMHVAPGDQPYLIRDLAWEAINYLREHNLVTVPPLAAETWGLQMMSPQRQLINPFFTGGNEISVSFPTDTMTHDQKLQSMRGNNIPFARATVHHELIPGHNLQFFMASRYRPYRRLFSTPFWGEGWALYWEMVLYSRGFPKTPEDRVGFLVWRKHRCARIVFSLSFHLGRMRPQECIDYLVANVGFDPHNAAAEVRRSFEGAEPLYQAAYMLGGLQFRGLRAELVDSGKMTDREFHDAILHAGNMPVVMVRALLTNQELTKDDVPDWRFYESLSNDHRVAGGVP